MDKPTEEQVKELWEWCGLKPPHINCEEPNHMSVPSGSGYFCLPVELDLGNLFKYAVPRLFKLGYWIKTSHHHSAYEQYESHSVTIGQHKFTGGGNTMIAPDPILALFWAIWGVVSLNPVNKRRQIMEYTKGERKVVYNKEREKYEVRIYRGGNMLGTLATFTKEADAQLDKSAPDLYEALMEAQKVVQWVLEEQTGFISDRGIEVGRVNEQTLQALAKAES